MSPLQIDVVAVRGPSAVAPQQFRESRWFLKARLLPNSGCKRAQDAGYTLIKDEREWSGHVRQQRAGEGELGEERRPQAGDRSVTGCGRRLRRRRPRAFRQLGTGRSGRMRAQGFSAVGAGRSRCGPGPRRSWRRGRRPSRSAGTGVSDLPHLLSTQGRLILLGLVSQEPWPGPDAGPRGGDVVHGVRAGPIRVAGTRCGPPGLQLSYSI
jgi:hypothetical protein